MAEIQVTKLTAKALREISAGSEAVTVMDGDEPLVRITPVSMELHRRKEFFVHYPHDPAECFGTCWRHTVKDAETEAVPA